MCIFFYVVVFLILTTHSLRVLVGFTDEYFRVLAPGETIKANEKEMGWVMTEDGKVRCLETRKKAISMHVVPDNYYEVLSCRRRSKAQTSAGGHSAQQFEWHKAPSLPPARRRYSYNNCYPSLLLRILYKVV